MTKVIVPILLLVALLVADLASDGPSSPAALTIVERDEVRTLDPAKMTWTQDIRVARAVYEGLVRTDQTTKDQSLGPAAAASMPDVSPDGLVYTFNLRPTARWSNGEPVRASDFVYAWRRMMLPDTGADYVQMFMAIKGAKTFHDQRAEALARFAADGAISDRSGEADRLWRGALAQFESSVGLRAMGEHTLRVELAEPLPYFLDYVAFVSFLPLHERTVSAYESLDAATGQRRWASDWSRPPVIVGNGPMKLVRWRFKRDMRLERNEHYWDPTLLQSESIDIRTIADANAMVNTFVRGGADWTTDVQVQYRSEMLAARAEFRQGHAEEVARLTSSELDEVAIDRALPSDPRSTIHAIPSFGTYFLNFYCGELLANGRPNPLADVRVRQALALSVDKQEIALAIRGNGEKPAGGLIPPGSIRGYTPPAGLGFEPERGRALLAQAGFTGGKGLPPIEYLFARDGGHELIAQSLQRNWSRELGVQIELVQVEGRVFGERVKTGKYMMSRASWFGDYSDPTTFLDISQSLNRNNDRRFADSRYDSMLLTASRERDPLARLALLGEAERYLIEDRVPIVPLFHFTQVYLFDAHRLEGLSVNVRQEQQLFRLRVTEDSRGK
ncbi:peptide ABC transporter substrate-binding protein [bacterium]|nr:MAG: peptide ABC transporter substrate-binding protein [bacterium]